jgi:hypothetical protein
MGPGDIHSPFGSSADSVFDNLSLFDWANLLEECDQFFSSQPCCKLLNENGTAITLILGQLRRLRF